MANHNENRQNFRSCVKLLFICNDINIRIIEPGQGGISSEKILGSEKYAKHYLNYSVLYMALII